MDAAVVLYVAAVFVGLERRLYRVFARQSVQLHDLVGEYLNRVRLD